MSNIIIHPKDESTDLLEKISKKLIDEFNDDIYLFRILPNIGCHNEALVFIEESPINSFFIYLGHGAHLCFSGAKDKSFEKPYYIVNDDLKIFKNKRLFAFTCKSAEYLNEYSDACDIYASLGFGMIPSEMTELEMLKEKDDFYSNISIEILNEFLDILIDIVACSLTSSISKDYSFQQIYNEIILRINKYMSKLILDKHTHGEILSTLLFIIKKDIKIFGNINIPLSRRDLYF